MSFWADARMAGRYLAGLRTYWRAPANWHDAQGVMRGWLAQRDEAFLQMLRQHIYGNPASPYLHLLKAARITLEDVARLTRELGLEGCLHRLHAAGVYVTLDEFKGRRPIQRLGLDLPVATSDFRVRAAAGQFVAPTGGSRSHGVATPVDVADLMYELPPRYLFSQAYGLLDRPFALWRPPPPGTAGLRAALRNLKLGMTMAHWFGVTRPGLDAGKSAVVTACTLLSAALSGRRIPYPRYTPLSQADVVARWLAERTARGAWLHLDTMTSAAARLCQEATRLGLDIHGHTLRVGGEPLTPAKAELFTRAGLRYCSQYAMTETATLGLSCPDSPWPDEMHLLTNRVALIQQPKALQGWPEPVGALSVTLFSPRMTSVLLNMEIGDYGVLEERTCSCPLGAAGLHTCLHTIHSYDKLTSVGMHFAGADLLDLLETALPARFGGGLGDYQFVESEADGKTVLTLVVSPRVGPLDERAAIAFTLDELERRTKAGHMMTDIWRQDGLLRVARAEPRATRAAKIQPLHVEHPV